MVKFNLTGQRRKMLVRKLSDILGVRSIYQGMPSMAFRVSDYLVDKEGTVTPDLPEDIINRLARAGFPSEVVEEEEQPASELAGVVITIPRDGITDEILTNFRNMATSKESLIRAAFGLNELLPIEADEDTVSVRWFEENPPEDVELATTFVTAMLEKAKVQKHVSPKPLQTDNPKYSMRVFTNSLGWIGNEYKTQRAAILKNLSGNSAFRHGREAVTA